MAVDPEGLANAGISPRERLARIEETLGRIDGKLDAKVAVLEARLANVERVQAEVRVRDLERTSDRERMVQRVDALDAGQGLLGKKLAYATGTLATLIVVGQVAAPLLFSR